MLAMELSIVSFSLLDSRQAASDIDFRVAQGRVAIILDRAHEIAQLRSVEFVGAVPYPEVSEFHVDCLRLMCVRAPVRLQFREWCAGRARHLGTGYRWRVGAGDRDGRRGRRSSPR